MDSPARAGGILDTAAERILRSIGWPSKGRRVSPRSWSLVDVKAIMNRSTLPAVLLVSFSWLQACAAEDQPTERPAARSYKKGVLIKFEGIILPQLERFTNRKLDQAQQLGADLVILEIDSPGGALEATFNLVARLRDINWAHTVAYIPNEALSGAAIVALACDEILMDPQARLGDAGPIFQGPDALFRHAPEKIRSDLALRVRDLASAKGVHRHWPRPWST